MNDIYKKAADRKQQRDAPNPRKHVITAENIQIIRGMGAVGVPQKLIAARLGISVTTLHNYYRDDLDASAASQLHQVATALFNNAIHHNNVTAQIFIMKCRGKWRETKPEDDEAANNEDMPITKIQFEVLKGIKPEDIDDD